jgi:nitroimidazol reductase NimA-like FMN-containing flavoprotein (pyridoxamine 5'-phosphate oxidase superfamily)
MFGKLKAEEIEELLATQLIGRIGCNAYNTTYVVPISYAYDGDYVYCHTYEGLKVIMMRTNPNVCFEVDTMDDMANWRSVITWGIFEELTKEEDQKKAIQVLNDRKLSGTVSQTLQLSPQWPFPPDDPGHVTGIVFRIKLYEKTGRFEKSEAHQFCGV